MKTIISVTKAHALFALLLTIFLLSGCGGATQGEDAPSTNASSNQSNNDSSGSPIRETATDDPIENDDSLASRTTGKTLYEAQCLDCHGDDGEGGSSGIDILTCNSCGDLDQLALVIARTMPIADINACDDACAADVANYIYFDLFNAAQGNSDEDSLNDNNGEDNDNDTSSETDAEQESDNERPQDEQTNVTDNTNTTNNGSNDAEATDTNESNDAVPELVAAQSVYEEQCSLCHGDTGDGGLTGIKLDATCSTCGDRNTLASVIANTMPTSDPESCDLNCATPIAEYILAGFDTSLPSNEDTSNGVAPTSDTDSGPDTNPEPETDSEESNTESNSSNNNDETDGTNNEEDSDNSDDPSAELTVVGQALYGEQCASCHGDTGTGGITGISLIGCSSCSDLSTLALRIEETMPPGNAGACDADCSSDIAQYVLDELNDTTTASVSITIEYMTPETTLYKAASSLAARPPSDDEQELVDTLGEAGLDLALDSIVNDEAFCRDRVGEIYNENLRTDGNYNESFYRIYPDSIYTNMHWYEEIDNSQQSRIVRESIQESFTKEPLMLIAHVVCNDLPFTEILTADYTVMNPHGARSLGVTDVTFDDPDDPEEYQPVRLNYGDQAVPHAGVLTSSSFLKRHQSTDSNINRGRAYRAYLFFLGTDVLSFNGFQPVPDSASFEYPEVENPNCAMCHQALDPIARAFFNWDNGDRRGVFFTNNGSDNSPIYEDRPNMWPAGFESEVMPDNEKTNALAWVAARMAADPRFARAAVTTMFEGITGHAPIATPDEDDAIATQAFLDQQSFFEDMTTYFVENNHNLKLLTKQLIINNPYFRANAITEFTPSEENKTIRKIGLARMLTPEMLTRKFYRYFWFTWMSDPNSFNTIYTVPVLEDSIGGLYGKIDNATELERVTEPNGIIASTQLQMATEMGLFSTLHDFVFTADERKLYRFVERDTVPYDAEGNEIPNNMSAIRNNIAYLHEYLYGNADSDEVEITYQLFLSIWQQGYANIQAGTDNGLAKTQYVHPVTHESMPNGDRIRGDNTYMIRAWGATLAYLINDYRFLYE